MDISLVFMALIALVFVLAVLLFVFFSPKKIESKEANKRVKKISVEDEEVDFDELRAVIRNRGSDANKLKKTLDLVIKHYGFIPKKNSGSAHRDFDKYMEVLYTICRHPNTTKDIIIDFDKELERRNPDYKKEINRAITDGLNSRG